ncbi:MAG: hypothetical protein KJ063_24390 [Anaerolineae bacterium]|nr:hypothetical protein [Anaerolineae bacterium]
MRGQAIATRITGDPTNNGLFYLHGDHLGSTSLLTYGSSPGNMVPGTTGKGILCVWAGLSVVWQGGLSGLTGLEELLERESFHHDRK